jgi:hypothetical protein
MMSSLHQSDTAHINIRHYFVRECVERGEFTPALIAGKVNHADLFTKALPKATFEGCIQRLGGISIPISKHSGRNP